MQALQPTASWLALMAAAIPALAALSGVLLVQNHTWKREREKRRAEVAEQRRSERLTAYLEFAVAVEQLRNAEMKVALHGGQVGDEIDRVIRASQHLQILAPKAVWEAARRLNLGASSTTAEGWPPGGAFDLRARYDAFYDAVRADLGTGVILAIRDHSP